MRLIAQFADERIAYSLYVFLDHEGISASFEAATSKERLASVWVIEEEDLARAAEALPRFEALSEEQKLKFDTPRVVPPSSSASTKEPLRATWRLASARELLVRRDRPRLTHFFIALCALLFFWNSLEEMRLARSGDPQFFATPLQQKLLFDFPRCAAILEKALAQQPLKSWNEPLSTPELKQKFVQAEHCSYWRGLYALLLDQAQGKKVAWTSAPLFEKIRQAQLWRLFTPSLLHRDFLHILFNMYWILFLGPQLEQRAGKWRMGLLMLIMGMTSNIAQYLMSGPYFLGSSGIVCGLVGFIWMRQRCCPWEGYPLSRSTTLFLAIFVSGMLLLSVLSFVLALIGVQSWVGSIANTAHVVGGLTGILLARISLFSRMPS